MKRARAYLFRRGDKRRSPVKVTKEEWLRRQEGKQQRMGCLRVSSTHCIKERLAVCVIIFRGHPR